MRDYFEIGCTPADEPCVQVGDPEYREKAKRECRAFLNQIRREKGPEPVGARLVIRANPHDFGTYYEVACEYDTNVPGSMEYAFGCEDVSENWDQKAKEELGLV